MKREELFEYVEAQWALHAERWKSGPGFERLGSSELSIDNLQIFYRELIVFYRSYTVAVANFIRQMHGNARRQIRPLLNLALENLNTEEVLQADLQSLGVERIPHLAFPNCKGTSVCMAWQEELISIDNCVAFLAFLVHQEFAFHAVATQLLGESGSNQVASSKARLQWAKCVTESSTSRIQFLRSILHEIIVSSQDLEFLVDTMDRTALQFRKLLDSSLAGSTIDCTDVSNPRVHKTLAATVVLAT